MRIVRFLSGTAIVAACVGDNTIITDAGSDATTTDAVSDVASEPIITGPISGTAILMNGVPFTGAHLDIGGKDIVTDSSGHFSAPDPGPTYDAVLKYSTTSFPVPTFTFFRGLTRRDPTLMAEVFPDEGTTSVVGVAKNAQSTVSTGIDARLVFSNVVWSSPVAIVGDAGSVSLSSLPFRNAPLPGTLYFYEETKNDAGNNTNYPYFASQPNVGLVNGGTWDASFTGNAANVGSVAVTFTLPTGSGWTDLVELRGVFGAAANIVMDMTSAGSPFTFNVPAVSGFKFLVDVIATSSTGGTSGAWDVVSANSSPTFTLPALPVVTSPAGNTLALAAQSIAYGGTNGVAITTLVCHNGSVDSGSNDVYIARVLTTATSVQAPTDSVLSLTLPPSGSNCPFAINATPNFATVDQAAGSSGYVNGLDPGFAAGGGSHAVTPLTVITAQ
jgi:hypothetical protein